IGLVSFLFLIPAITSGAAAQEAGFQAALQDYVTQDELNGGALFVGNADGGYTVVAGLADRDAGTPVTPDTRFYVASSGKMVVAAAVLAYVEEGVFDLDAPVYPHVRDLAGIDALANIKQVTLRQVLNHTSGLADYLDEDFFNDSSDAPS